MFTQLKEINSLKEVAPSATILYRYKTHTFQLQETDDNKYQIKLYEKPINPPYYLSNITHKYSSSVGKYYKQCGYISFESYNISNTLNILFN